MRMRSAIMNAGANALIGQNITVNVYAAFMLLSRHYIDIVYDRLLVNLGTFH